jgi:hypothetical protein
MRLGRLLALMGIVVILPWLMVVVSLGHETGAVAMAVDVVLVAGLAWSLRIRERIRPAVGGAIRRGSRDRSLRATARRRPG